MPFRTILLVAFFSLTAVFRQASYGAEPPKQTKAGSANASRAEKRPVHITVRSQTEIKQTFTCTLRILPFPTSFRVTLALK